MWKPVKGYEGRYAISDDGQVRSLGRKYVGKFGDIPMPTRTMVLSDHKDGYKVVWLRNGLTHKKFFIHRLVAMAFIPNPDAKDIVNHIDENKSNNTVRNLEWMSNTENLRYYHANRKKSPAKPNDNDEVNQIAAHILAHGF